MHLAIFEGDLLLLQVFASVFRARGHTVCEARCLDELAGLLADQSVAVCLVDPDHTGSLAGLAALRAAHPGVSFVAYSSPDARAVAALRAAGVDAIVGKLSDLDAVVAAVESQGRPGREAATSVSRLRRWEADGIDERLTPRELEVLQALAQGASTSRIARQMQISQATTRSHVQNVLRKLGAHSRLEAVALAVDGGLLPTGPLQPWVSPLGAGHKTAAVS